MAVDLVKHKDSLLAAWKAVVSDKDPTNWAIMSYEPNSNILKVVSTGEDGLEEMIDDLNSGKIMYAYCKVEDSHTTLNKFVLINWQGEGAPIARKGTCASHLRDVTNLFHGAHVTINARTDDDVEVDAIMDKISKSTVSSFNFHEKPKPPLQTKPVGSVYKRIVPERDIDASARDEFWEQTEVEERKRKTEDRKKSQAETEKLEGERLVREEKEGLHRDKITRERAASVRSQREAERMANVSKTEEDKKKWEEEQASLEREDDAERRRRADSLRKERLKEANELVERRGADPRAMFEQHITPAAQRHSRPPPKVLRDWKAKQEEQQEAPSRSLPVVPAAAGDSSLPSKVTPQPLAREPSPPRKREPSPPKKREPSPPRKREPSPPKKREPSPPTKREPSPPTKREPSPPTKREPSPPVRREPSPPARGPSPPHREPTPERQPSPVKTMSEPAVPPHTRNLLAEGLPPRVESPEEEEDQDWEEPPLEEGPTVTAETEQHLIEEEMRRSVTEAPEPPHLTPQRVPPSLTEDDDEEAEIETFQEEEQMGAAAEEEEEGEFEIPYTNQSARALYDYQAADETEITFDPDDTITHVDQIDPGWWRGFGPDGTYGLFPANYVELISS
ncbi:PREDICTED: drebrin-like protein B [Priapulus caudatus]|uniref:Drebrin-like protein B n=1 Tax=Priapulus caudatus TaxID=37621 RepID=A0ABM1ES68_PRICU|nr:PREDICTED: drebrin-like protein B [Priapulus caudatus]